MQVPRNVLDPPAPPHPTPPPRTNPAMPTRNYKRNQQRQATQQNARKMQRRTREQDSTWHDQHVATVTKIWKSVKNARRPRGDLTKNNPEARVPMVDVICKTVSLGPYNWGVTHMISGDGWWQPHHPSIFGVGDESNLAQQIHVLPLEAKLSLNFYCKQPYNHMFTKV